MQPSDSPLMLRHPPCSQGPTTSVPQTLEGRFSAGGALPVNPSGGSLGAGHLFDAAGLYKIAESAQQLRGDAGALQIADANRCLVQSWRGVPTATGGVAVLSNHHG